MLVFNFPLCQRHSACFRVIRVAFITVVCSHIIHISTCNKCTKPGERLHPAAERLAA
jgi:hypothetical protein